MRDWTETDDKPDLIKFGPVLNARIEQALGKWPTHRTSILWI